MSQVEIVQRLLAKECLRRAFIAADVRWWDSPIPPDSHGEFGKVQDWNKLLRIYFFCPKALRQGL